MSKRNGLIERPTLRGSFANWLREKAWISLQLSNWKPPLLLILHFLLCYLLSSWLSLENIICFQMIAVINSIQKKLQHLLEPTNWWHAEKACIRNRSLSHNVLYNKKNHLFDDEPDSTRKGQNVLWLTL